MRYALLGLFLCLSVGATEITDVVSTRLCDFWKYDFESQADVCSFVGSRVRLVEADDYQRTIRALEKRIVDLEARLESLENRSQKF